MYRPQPQPRQQGGQPQQQIVLPDVDQVGTLVVRGVTTFARRHKSVTGFYLLGWIFLLFVGSGTKLTVDQQRTFGQITASIDTQAEYDATDDFLAARQRYYGTKGWFSCDGTCQRHKARMVEAEAALTAIRKEGAARMQDAKRTVGILSEVGVEEVKDSFWGYFYQGKQFAKRQSAWDAFFIGIRQISRSRDESWIEYGIKVLMQVMINFTMGLAMALVFFWFGLWSLVRDYEANPLVAALIFVGAAAAAFAYVVSYLLAIYGATAGSVYGVLKVAESTQRARIADAQRQGRVGNNAQRPHYD